MIKPRPPHQAADKFLRLAKLAVTLGMEFEDAAIGVDHELIASIGPALPRLSSALQTLSQDMRRQAMTPPPEPPPVPKPTPILDFLESKEQAEAPPRPTEIVPETPAVRPFAAFVGRNPVFYVLAASIEAAGDAINAAMPEHSITRVQAVEPEWATARKLPDLAEWMDKHPSFVPVESTPHPKVPTKRPTPAPSRPEPGEKLGKRQCWMALVAGIWAFRIYRHTEAEAAAQLAEAGIPRKTWPEARLTLELTNQSHHHNDVPALSDLTPEKARQRVRELLAEYEASTGSGFVAPMEQPPTKEAEADDQADYQPQIMVARHVPTGRTLFQVAAIDARQAEDFAGMELTNGQLEELEFFPTEEPLLGVPDWEAFNIDTWPSAIPGEPEIIPAPAPTIPAYPTESPRDPLAELPIGELDLRKPVLELLVSRDIATAGQLFDELGGDVLDGLLTEEQEEHVRKKILRWESERHSRIVADGSWLDEELTYAAFRLGDAPAFWARMRERGATDAELRDAINKRFFVMGGTETAFRAGYYFVSGAAPAFFRGASKPKRDAEPALEGKRLVDAVRRLLAIPTREEPTKAPARRKAVKA